MKDNFERIKQDIELIYLPLEEQLEKAGCLVGNSFFDTNQLAELNRFKSNREKIWKEIEKNFDPEKCFKIAGVIFEGFTFMAKDSTNRDLSRAYLASKKKILDYVKKQNEKLIKQGEKITNKDALKHLGVEQGEVTPNENNPYFKRFPIQVAIANHHLDFPIKAHCPTIGKTGFIKRIGAEIEDNFPTKYERAKFVSRILRFFFAVLKAQADPKIIRNQF
jgi:hypothetical protein